MRKINYYIVIMFLGSLLFYRAELFADVPPENEWRVVESEFCTIKLHPEVEIKDLSRKIKIDFYDLFLNKRERKNKTIEGEIAYKFDLLFKKTEKILDMYPRRIHLNILVYKDQSELNEVYKSVLGENNTNRRISWYVHRFTTIYTSEKVISSGVIAHEMGHAIIDHYFLILPPESVEELLAQYVEVHLND